MTDAASMLTKLEGDSGEAAKWHRSDSSSRRQQTSSQRGASAVRTNRSKLHDQILQIGLTKAQFEEDRLMEEQGTSWISSADTIVKDEEKISDVSVRSHLSNDRRRDSTDRFSPTSGKRSDSIGGQDQQCIDEGAEGAVFVMESVEEPLSGSEGKGSTPCVTPDAKAGIQFFMGEEQQKQWPRSLELRGRREEWHIDFDVSSPAWVLTLTLLPLPTALLHGMMLSSCCCGRSMPCSPCARARALLCPCIQKHSG